MITEKNFPETKTLQRLYFRQKRAAIPELERLSQSLSVNRALAIFLAELIEKRREQADQALRVCAYMAVGTELTLEPLLEDELSRAVAEGLLEFYIPKTYQTEDGTLELVFGHYRSTSGLGCDACKHGRLGIPEPAEEDLQIDLQPDVVLLPCVAFDERGSRVGQGAGCYDRYLSALALSGIRPISVVVGYKEQLSGENLTADPHDWPMDFLAYGAEVVPVKIDQAQMEGK